MKKQFDKEALIKNRFWIGLGLSVVFALVAFICVLGIRSTATAKFNEADKVDKDLKAILTQRDSLRNQRWIDRMKEETAKSEAQKDVVWKDGFDKQQKVTRESAPAADPAADPAAAAGTTKQARGKIIEIREPFITWHPEVRDQVVDVGRANLFRSRVRDLDFGEKMHIVPLPQYKDTYLKQFEDLVKQADLELLNEQSGRGAMRVFGGGKSHSDNLYTMLHPHRLTDRPVTSEEAWILQEDFALKRDLLKNLVEANQAVANMQSEWRLIPPPEEVKSDAAAGDAPPAVEKLKEAEKPKDAAAALAQKRFYNTTWTTGVTLQPAAEGKPAVAAPRIEWWQGWQLDLTLSKQGAELVLKGTTANLSPIATLPTTSLAVYLADANGKELAEPLLLTDAGGLTPSTQDRAGALTKLSARELKPLAAPKDAAQIVRVQRVAARPAMDEQRFYNGDWLVELKLVPGTGNVGAAVEGRIINRSGRMTIPATFELTFSDGKETFVGEAAVKQTKGEPFKASEERAAVRAEVRRTTAPKRIVSVRQIADWRSVAIKQINRIEFTDAAHAQSDRTKVRDLKTYPFFRKDPSGPGTAPAPLTGGADAGKADAGGSVGTSGIGGGAGPMGAGSSTPAITDAHKVPLRRYYEVTDEVRRVPFALVLVVDAAHMNDVLASLANSRLRVQVTQVVWNRMPAGLPKPAFSSKPAAPASAGQDRPTSPLKPGAGAPPGYPSGPGTSGAGPGAAGAGGPAGAGPRGPVSVEEETSEIELQIYGLISIYENPDAIQRLAEMRAKAPAVTAAPDTATK